MDIDGVFFNSSSATPIAASITETCLHNFLISQHLLSSTNSSNFSIYSQVQFYLEAIV